MIKKGVQLYGIRPEMVLCDTIVQSVFNKFGQVCRRTSIIGKEHSKYSLHPVGFAVDYGTKQIKSSMFTKRTSILLAIVRELEAVLPQCDIVLEFVGGKQEHIHVEFDPKDDPKFQGLKARYKEIGRWGY